MSPESTKTKRRPKPTPVYQQFKSDVQHNKRTKKASEKGLKHKTSISESFKDGRGSY